MQISNEDRILIVAPHPDDESIGCGGLLLQYGNQCDIMLLTDGRKGYLSTDCVDEDQLVRERESELRAAAKSVGVQKVIALRIPDGHLKTERKRVKQEDISSYSMIFVPNRHERHKDHCVVTSIFLSMIKKKKLKCRLFEYEVWSPLASPTDYLDISGYIQQKESLISIYQSQLKYLDYIKMASCLNGYRGAGRNVEYAEAYSKVEIVSLPKRMYLLLPYSVRKAIHKCLKE